MNRIKSQSLLTRGAAVLCALSGGADSTAMVRVLHALRETLDIGGFAAAHFNHRLRGAESDGDREFCVRLCEKLDIRLFCGEDDVAGEAKRLGMGTEAAGRRMRYAFLTETAAANGFTHIATAHTAADNAETILLNLTRGSGLTGLTGIPPSRPAGNGARIVRPMLAATRDDELEYLAGLGQDYRIDGSNLGDGYRRNRIRSRVIPYLREENPALFATLTRMSELLRSDMEYLEHSAELAAEAITTAPNTVSASRLHGLPAAIAGRAVRLMCKNALARGGVPDISEKHVAAVLKLCESSPGAEAHLPFGLVARRIYDDISIKKGAPPAAFLPVAIAFGQTVNIPELGLMASWSEKPKKVNNLVYSFALNSDTIRSGLTVRPRKEGDSVRLAGRKGTKTLQNLFVDGKIPRHERGTVPVLSDETGIVAVGGFGTAARCAPRENGGDTSFQIYGEEPNVT